LETSGPFQVPSPLDPRHRGQSSAKRLKATKRQENKENDFMNLEKVLRDEHMLAKNVNSYAKVGFGGIKHIFFVLRTIE
jgi:hypothetical protein